MELLREPETWVAIAFVIFVCFLGYLGVHNMVSKALDDRAGRIRAELDEARKLKDEAAELLAEYQRKQHAAESEAEEIIAGAKAEAERLATEFVARRTAMAETKIAQAEAQAAADVRSAAAEAAVAAAEKILNVEAKGKLAGELLAKGIEDVRKKLN
jgi:F-type H+-transporting ATPase subunit b